MTPPELEPCPRAARRLRLAIGLCALGLVLTGCAPLSQQQRPLPDFEVPPAWEGANARAAGAQSSLAQWWMRMNDPLLTRLVELAQNANSSVTGAQAGLRQARALRDVAAAGLMPSLDGSASAQRSRSGNNSAASQFRLGLDASWELDVFGANRSALQASAATAGASAANLGGVQVSIAAEVVLAYISLRGLQGRLAIANANLASQQEVLQLTAWRLQAGLVSSLESEQARGATEQTGAQLPALRAGITQAIHALSVLTGQPPAALSALLASPAPVPLPATELALGIPAETLRQRPDVSAAEFQLVAAMARVSQSRAQTLPSFRLSGSLGLNALKLGSLASGGAVAAALLAGVAMPLFDGGAGQAQVRAQQAALEQAHALYQAAVLTALKEVEDALAALQGDRERLQRLQLAADAAGSAALMARQRYGSGLVDFQVVLDTQRAQLNTQDSVANARADLSADHVRLYKALGGGWVADDSVPSPAAAAQPLWTAT